VIDKLAQEYASQPVVFLEVDEVYHKVGNRDQIWWAVWNKNSASWPMVMVDSGHQISSGYLDFHTKYKEMIDAELVHPPQAEVTGSVHRAGNAYQFSVQVKNLTNTPLSSANDAHVYAIVYEDAHVGVTSRIVRATVSTSITGLAPQETKTYSIATADLSDSVLNWDKLHMVVLADYRSSSSPVGYDMLQAAILEDDTITVLPNPISFLVDPGDSQGRSATVQMTGPSTQTWIASVTVPWLQLSTSSGSISTPPTLSVDETKLSPGVQTGELDFSFTGPGGQSTQVKIPVSAYLGPVKHIGLPLIQR
jgi:hypothetical protein